MLPKSPEQRKLPPQTRKPNDQEVVDVAPIQDIYWRVRRFSLISMVALLVSFLALGISIKLYSDTNSLLNQNGILPTAAPTLNPTNTSVPAPPTPTLPLPSGACYGIVKDIAPIRETPDSDAAQVGARLAGGDQVIVMGKNGDGNWYEVVTYTERGWMFTLYLDINPVCEEQLRIGNP